MRSPLLLTLALLPAFAAAEVYKWTGADGRVHYGDRPPSPQAQPLNLPPSQTFKAPASIAPPAPGTNSDGAAQNHPPSNPDTSSYEALAITFPKHDAAIRDNAGNVAVHVTTSPRLRAELGHRLTLRLDGAAKFSTTDPILQLDNVDRGTHTVQVEVTDKDGQTLATSDPVTFHLQRASVLRR